MKKRLFRDFPGSPVVKTLPSNAGGTGSIPGGGPKIPHALQPKNQNIKQKQYCSKFSKDFINGPYQKKKNFKNSVKKNFFKKEKKDFLNVQICQRLSPYLP